MQAYLFIIIIVTLTWCDFLIFQCMYLHVYVFVYFCMCSKIRNPLAQMEEEKREHDMKMKKMEAEMEQVFEMKVKEKKQKLKDSEAELTRRHEERKKVRKKINQISFQVVGMKNQSLLCPSFNFRHWKCKSASWKSVNVHSNKRNTNGKAQMVLPLMNWNDVASKQTAKSMYTMTFLTIFHYISFMCPLLNLSHQLVFILSSCAIFYIFHLSMLLSLLLLFSFHWQYIFCSFHSIPSHHILTWILRKIIAFKKKRLKTHS